MRYIEKETLNSIAMNKAFCHLRGIVYVIENTVNRKVYVGITSNTFVRRYGLVFESHNEHLNRSIEKYGLDKFVAYICYAEIHDYSKLQSIEKRLIKQYNSNKKEYGYNKTLGGEGTLGYEFTENDYLRIQVPVVALNKDGSFYKEYRSQKQVYDELGVYITDCLKMRTRTAHGLIWLYKEEYDKMSESEIEERAKWAAEGLTQIKRIIALDRDGSFVKEYSSVIAASKDLDCSCGTLTNCCRHKVKTYKNMIWFYKSEYMNLSSDEIEDIIDECNENNRGKNNLNIPIVCLNLISGEYVKTYSSAHDAEKEIGVPDSNGHIIACCKGKLSSCYGYKWCYEIDFRQKTPIYYSIISKSAYGRRPVVALEISTGILVNRFESITEAMVYLNKQGGGSISMCCSGKLNYCYGYRWMYEDEYVKSKDKIVEVIREADRKKKENRSLCRAIPVVIVWNGITVKKKSIKDISLYFQENYGISNVRDWFKSRGVPQKYRDKVSFCGTEEEYSEYDLHNNIE